MPVNVLTLGASKEVGKSCIIVYIGDKTIMFDCGIHMGYQDMERFPDFSVMFDKKNLNIKERKETIADPNPGNDINKNLDCIILSHLSFRCIALFHGSSRYPTKAVCPILLSDYCKVTENSGAYSPYNVAHIEDCFKKAIPLAFGETVVIENSLKITPYPAGHVLGASMWHAIEGTESVVYTGDFNMTADRHLGAATIDKLKPDVLITETTYCTSIRNSKRTREMKLLKAVSKVVKNGGKVLIPVFALGRAQELMLLMDTYWERMSLSIPIYFSAGLTSKATMYYRMFISWMNQQIQETFADRNMFEFKHIQQLDKSMIDSPEPMVLMAAPGMLHAGLSLQVFKKWAGNKKNMIVIPGYCIHGTVGSKLQAGEKRVKVDETTTIDVNCEVKSLSFSAHADAKGIVELVKRLQPKSIVLVHGEGTKMKCFGEILQKEIGIPVHFPELNERYEVKRQGFIPLDLSTGFLRKRVCYQKVEDLGVFPIKKVPRGCGNRDKINIDGILLMESKKVELVEPHELEKLIGKYSHKLSFVRNFDISPHIQGSLFMKKVCEALSRWFFPKQVLLNDDCIHVNTLHLSLSGGRVKFLWEFEDEELALRCLRIMDVLPKPFY